MAVDISNLTSLITSFSAITQKDAITPSSLATLLQKVATALSGAASTTDLKTLTSLVNNNAQDSDEADDAIKASIATINNRLTAIDQTEEVAELKAAIANLTNAIHIQAEVVGGKLYIRGPIAVLRALGYHPVLFRHCKKSNRINVNDQSSHSPARRGWCRFGYKYTLKMQKDGLIMISGTSHDSLSEDSSQASTTYYADASKFVQLNAKGYVAWGKSRVSITKDKARRQLVLPFAIAFYSGETFGAALDHSKLMTDLAKFTVRYAETKNDGWKFCFSR